MMKLTATSKNVAHPQADALLVPFWQHEKKAICALPRDELKTHFSHSLACGDFVGKEGEILFLYPSGLPEKRLVLLGLGNKEKLTIERLRRAYASFVKQCRDKKISHVNILLPHHKGMDECSIVNGAVEGLLLANYTFEKLKHDSLKEGGGSLLKKANFIDLSSNALAVAKQCASMCNGVYLARDLVNGNADDVTPQHLAKVARELTQKHSHVKITIFNKKRIEKEKMGLLLAVSQASTRDPVFIIVEYKGQKQSKDHTVIIGKGITYDTGGLNLKQPSSMETMKADMGGAAACLGILAAAIHLNMKCNFTLVIPSCENAISSKSYKLGDVYKSYAGKTIEVGNTDAEGRLILADALSYAIKHLKPSRIIDIATLTGSIEVALGAEASGLFCNDDTLADALIRAADSTFERTWRMPLYVEHREQLRSDIADLKNVGSRSGGAITAALFLQEFVGNVPWAHLDIAGVAYLKEARRYNPKYGTGSGVRLLINFLQNLQ